MPALRGPGRQAGQEDPPGRQAGQEDPPGRQAGQEDPDDRGRKSPPSGPGTARLDVGGSYFAGLYRQAPDPWSFATSWYERRKYDLTLAALPRRRYAAGFEPGCSVGVLSAGLARRCRRLVCYDIDPTAVARARDRLLPWPGAAVRQASVPVHWPDERFDLIVLSEIGYYLGEEAWAEVLDCVEATLAPGDHVVAVHWRPAIEGCSLTGTDVHRILAQRRGLRALSRHVEDRFVLDVLEARSAP